MILGHQKIWQFLTQSANLNKLAHAYLFSGQEKLGKRTLAIEFVNWLFKEDIQKREHPDFILIEPIKKEIQIFQIRELNWRLSLQPFIAPLKIAIINQAHCLNSEAQNCFLKTLEEPKDKTLLILISEYPQILFPTILSRVQKIKFYPVKKTELEQYLKQKGGIKEKEKREEILNFSLSRPGRVIDFLSNHQKIETQKKMISDLIKLLNSDLSFRFQYVKNLFPKESEKKDVFNQLKEILDVWLLYFRNILINTENFQPLRYSLNKLVNTLKIIQNTNFLLSTTNVNPRLALEILMLEL